MNPIVCHFWDAWKKTKLLLFFWAWFSFSKGCRVHVSAKLKYDLPSQILFYKFVCKCIASAGLVYFLGFVLVLLEELVCKFFFHGFVVHVWDPKILVCFHGINWVHVLKYIHAMSFFFAAYFALVVRAGLRLETIVCLGKNHIFVSYFNESK